MTSREVRTLADKYEVSLYAITALESGEVIILVDDAKGKSLFNFKRELLKNKPTGMIYTVAVIS